MFEDFEDVEKEEGVDFRTLFRLRLELLLGETLVREGVALRRALRWHLQLFNKKYVYLLTRTFTLWSKGQEQDIRTVRTLNNLKKGQGGIQPKDKSSRNFFVIMSLPKR